MADKWLCIQAFFVFKDGNIPASSHANENNSGKRKENNDPSWEMGDKGLTRKQFLNRRERMGSNEQIQGLHLG